MCHCEERSDEARHKASASPSVKSVADESAGDLWRTISATKIASATSWLRNDGHR